jgi:hypothetical protein
MRTSTVFGAVVALAAICGLALAGVAVHEISYASAHPYRYGPAKVIATAAGAGAVLSMSVGLLAGALLRDSRSSR